MKSITWRIFLPIILVLVIVFSFLIFFIGKAVNAGMVNQFQERAEKEVDSIYLLIESLYESEMIQSEEMLDNVEDMLQQETALAMKMMEWFYSRTVEGFLTEEEARFQAFDAITSLLYGEEGYFFIMNGDYFMVAHPSASAVVGVSWEDRIDAQGKAFIKELVDVAKSGNGDFVEYEFPKLGSDEALPKLGYSLYFEPWDLIIGTGVYVDYIEEENTRLRERTIRNLNQLLYKDVDASKAYPFVKTRDDRYIAYINQERVGQISSSQDKVTGEDLTSKYFSIASGPVSYYFTKSGEDADKYFRKVGSVKVFAPLDWVVVYTVYEDVLKESTRNITFILIFSGLVTIFISGAFIIFIVILIARKVKNAARGFEEFATGSGDLTRRMEGIGGDEVGQMIGSFNRFLDKLQSIILEIRNVAQSSKIIGHSLKDDAGNISTSLEQIVSNVSSIESSSEKLNSHSDLTSSALNDIFNAVEVVNHQIVEEAASVEESSAAIEEMIASVNNISRISSERKDEVDKLTGMASESSRQMDSTMQDISRIADSVDSITEVISVINGISSRINLLAMNAAIEAAHAGDAGKGFAVVADEVRKLAESTGENSKRISESIQNIIEEITNTKEKSQQTGQMIKTMEDGSRSVSQMITEVIAAISEVSSGNRQILEALGTLKTSSLAVKESSALVEDKAQFAVTAVEEIAGLSHQNYQGVIEIRGALTEISESVNHISDLGSQNSDNLDRINIQVGNFKVEKDSE